MGDFLKKAGAPEKKPTVSIDMIRAGLEVFRAWNPEEDDSEAMVAAIFMVMRDVYFARNSS